MKKIKALIDRTSPLHVLTLCAVAAIALLLFAEWEPPFLLRVAGATGWVLLLFELRLTYMWERIARDRELLHREMERSLGVAKVWRGRALAAEERLAAYRRAEVSE